MKGERGGIHVVQNQHPILNGKKKYMPTVCIVVRFVALGGNYTPPSAPFLVTAWTTSLTTRAMIHTTVLAYRGRTIR